MPKANPATTAPMPAVACAPAAADPPVDVAPPSEVCDAADGVEVVAKMMVVPVLFPLEALAALKSRPQSVISDATSVEDLCQLLSRIKTEKHLISAERNS